MANLFLSITEVLDYGSLVKKNAARKKRKRRPVKTRAVPLDEMGLSCSLFPRYSVPDDISEVDEDEELEAFLRDEGFDTYEVITVADINIDYPTITDAMKETGNSFVKCSRTGGYESVGYVSTDSEVCKPARKCIPGKSAVFHEEDRDLEEEFHQSACSRVIRQINTFANCYKHEIERHKKKNKKLSARLQIRQHHIYELHFKARGKRLMMKYHLRASAMKPNSCKIIVPEKSTPFEFSHPRFRNIAPSRFSTKASSPMWDAGLVMHGTNVPAVNGCKGYNGNTVRNTGKHHVKHEITARNMDFTIPADVANILLVLQHRDVTPEDYELLLRLDERVAPKTVSMSVVDRLNCDVITEVNMPREQCTICMENYELNQKMTTLKCSHAFHKDCIEKWLLQSSVNCPLDGTPIDQL